MSIEAARTFADRFADAVGADHLSAEDADRILELAGVSAHASVRQAAPLVSWLAGAAGLAPAEALARAEALAERPVDG